MTSKFSYIHAVALAGLGRARRPTSPPQELPTNARPTSLNSTAAAGSAHEQVAARPPDSDLAFASAVRAAVDRMHDAPTLDQLFASIVLEAMSLIPADAAALIEHRQGSWKLLARSARKASGLSAAAHAVGPPLTFRSNGTAAVDIQRGIEAGVEAGIAAEMDVGIATANDRGFLDGPVKAIRVFVDSSIDTSQASLTAIDPPSTNIAWSTLLIGGPVGWSVRHPIRLVWFARSFGVLSGSAAPADVFVRAVDRALKSFRSLDTLTQAVAARHRVGVAQGILMARNQWSAEEAFTVLRQCSQHSNVKLHLLAEQVIAARQLPGDTTPPRKPRRGAPMSDTRNQEMS